MTHGADPFIGPCDCRRALDEDVTGHQMHRNAIVQFHVDFVDYTAAYLLRHTTDTWRLPELVVREHGQHR